MLSKMNDLIGGYTVIVTTTYVQRRRHKKKRINKKWIKRYVWIHHQRLAKTRRNGCRSGTYDYIYESGNIF